MSNNTVWQVREGKKRAPEVQQALAPLSPVLKVVASEGVDAASIDLSFTISCHGVSRKLMLPATVFLEENPAASILARARIQLAG